MKSDGAARRAFCYVVDATEGFFRVLLHGQPGRSYNVGNEEAELSILDRHTSSATCSPWKRPRADGDEYADSPISRHSPDTSRLRALGWAPATTVRDGFLRTVSASRADAVAARDHRDQISD